MTEVVVVSDEPIYEDATPHIFTVFKDNKAWDELGVNLTQIWHDFEGDWYNFGRDLLANCFRTILSAELSDEGTVNEGFVSAAVDHFHKHIKRAVESMAPSRIASIHDPDEKIAELNEVKRLLSHVVPVSYADVPRGSKDLLYTFDNALFGATKEYRYSPASISTTAELLRALMLMVTTITSGHPDPYTYNEESLRSSEIVVYMYMVLCFYDGLKHYIQDIKDDKKRDESLRYAFEVNAQYDEKSKHVDHVAENHKLLLFICEKVISIENEVRALHLKQSVEDSQIAAINSKLGRLMVNHRAGLYGSG